MPKAKKETVEEAKTPEGEEAAAPVEAKEKKTKAPKEEPKEEQLPATFIH